MTKKEKDEFAGLKAKLEEYVEKAKHPDDCPHCGRCKHCGRGDSPHTIIYRDRPNYPWTQPWNPWTVPYWTVPYWQVECGDNITINGSGDSSGARWRGASIQVTPTGGRGC